MDTSEKYIKMCEAAQEIQNYCYIGDNDTDNCVLYSKLHQVIISSSMSGNQKLWENKFIWLPRQDQLQEIIHLGEDKGLSLCKINSFYEFLFSKTSLYINEGSFEQLWLAFVMQEKYNKIWNEEKQEWNTKN